MISSRSSACIAAAAADKLAFAAVDEDELRQRLLLVDHSAITTENGLVHRRKIVRSFDRSDNKSPVIGPRGLAVLKDNDAGDIFRSRDIRYVERLDPFGEMSDISSSSCSSSSTFCESGLSTRKRCSNAILAFVSTSSTRCRSCPAFRVQDRTRRPRRSVSSCFKHRPVVEILRHVDLERHVIGRVILRQYAAKKFAGVERFILGRSSQKNSRRPTMRPSRIVKSCSASRCPSR